MKTISSLEKTIKILRYALRHNITEYKASLKLKLEEKISKSLSKAIKIKHHKIKSAESRTNR